MAKSRLFLLDGHALCYRAFYAVRDLKNSKGQATNAIFGFVNILKKILKDFHPEYIAVCFDSPTKTKRQERYADYKIQRESMPDDLRAQIPIIKEVISAYRIPVFVKDGYEADDIIATIATKLKHQLEVIIVSDDKDMYQLVDQNIKMYSSRKDAILGPNETIERFGVRPEQIGDLLALMGDKSDNIPGVKGIGAVTAKKLLKQFDSIEAILANTKEISAEKVREKIENEVEQARLSHELAQLEFEVPLEYDLGDLKSRTPDEQALFDIFTECEFRRWLEDLSVSETALNTNVDILQGCLDNKNDVDSFRAEINKTKQCVFLIHQDELYVATNKIVVKGALDDLSQWTDVLCNEGVTKVVYDAKNLQKCLWQYEQQSLQSCFDILLAGYLLLSGKSNLDIASLTWFFCEQTITQENEGYLHAYWLGRLYDPILKMLKDDGLMSLYEQMEWPLAQVLFDMEKIGVKVDQKQLQTLSEECSIKIEKLRLKLYELAGEEFNLNSPKQLQVILFEKLGLPPIKKTKTGYSTNEEVLHRLAPMHELPQLILDYRQIAKLQSTYIDALPKLIDADTGRIHALFHQTGAETGRLSSSHPNLQNIPIRTELGRKIRKAFVATSNKHELIAADYSQIELRVMAHLSGDEQLTKAFNSNQDIHNYTAKLIFDCEDVDIDYHKRDTAKRVNFGIVYGISAFGLAKDLQITQPEAQQFIDLYFERYPKVKNFMEHCVEDAKKMGYVKTLMNRRRYIPDIKNRNATLRHFAERQAINTPVQGSAADLIKLAMIRIHHQLKANGFESQLTITVHDELVFDALKSERKDLVALIKQEMEAAMNLSVPIVATVKVGDHWNEMEQVA